MVWRTMEKPKKKEKTAHKRSGTSPGPSVARGGRDTTFVRTSRATFCRRLVLFSCSRRGRTFQRTFRDASPGIFRIPERCHTVDGSAVSSYVTHRRSIPTDGPYEVIEPFNIVILTSAARLRPTPLRLGNSAFRFVPGARWFVSRCTLICFPFRTVVAVVQRNTINPYQ